ncbi:MAG: chemotaxis protein CheR [Alphaproteobacteria bacterium]|nr:chemotaxis protein CheR [Alphaproteobacteria bacterium]
MGKADTDCVELLQWALPRLGLRWDGYRKVRGQVCKRLRRRAGALGLDGLAAYRARLEADPREWRVLDDCCHVTISRFFRDRAVFEALRRRVLPAIAARARREGRPARCWSAGCASGEEPYTVRILWDLEAAPDVALTVVATDVDAPVLARAEAGCFEAASLRELPASFVAAAFERTEAGFRVRERHREGMVFLRQDVREETPEGPFDLVLCRYLAFTYFAPAQQRAALALLVDRLAPGGWLVIGTHERLPPDGGPRLVQLEGAPQIFRLAEPGAVTA